MKNQKKGSNYIYHQRKAQLDALNGEYNGWYVRSLGGAPHAKIIFGAV